MKTLSRDDRAVSESLGYVIIFGVIVACIALVMVTGSQIITDTERQSSFNAMKQGFEVIGADHRKIAFEGSPVMMTRVNVDSGTLYIENSSEEDRRMMVYVSPLMFGYPYLTPVYGMSLGAITYQSDIYGQSLSIENGAEVEMYNGNGKRGTIMTSEPRIFYSPATKTLLIDVINLQGINQSLTGGVCSIESRYQNFSISPHTLSAGDFVTICVKSPYVGAWDNYFSSGLIPGLTPDTGGDTDHWCNVSVQGVEKLVIVTYNVSVTLS